MALTIALGVLSATFAFMAAIFLLVSRLRRRHHAEETARLASVDGVVVDRVEREPTSPGGARVPAVVVTVEYRDHHGMQRRLTADEGSHYRFVGDTTPVFYDRLAPADARLELPGIDVFRALGLLFVALTLLFAVLAIASW